MTVKYIDSLYVFDLTETLLAILDPNDTIGPYYDAVHLEQLNKENSFSFKIPANNVKADSVIEGNLVAFKDLDGDFQLFEIKIINELHEDYIIKEVFCENAALELLDEIILYLWDRDQTATIILGHALSGTRWSVGTVTVSGLASVKMELNNPLEVIKMMIEAFGAGEVKYRVTISGKIIANRYVDFLSRRGSVTGKRFEYGKDTNSIKREVDVTSVKTALYGFGKSQEVPGGSKRIMFTEVTWTTPANPRNKPLSQNYIEDTTAKSRWGRASGTRHRWGYFEDPDETDPIKLLEKTNAALDKAIIPSISYEMKIDDLERISGLTHEKVRLGDTVYVIDNTFRPSLFVGARVLEIKRYLMEPEKDSLVLGDFKQMVIQDGQSIRTLETSVHSNQGVWTDSAYKNNSITDHSFENIPRTGSPDADQVYQVDKTGADYGSNFWWLWSGTGYVISTYDTTTLMAYNQLAIFDYQAAVISSDSKPYQYVPLNKSVGKNGPYTASCYMSAYIQTTTNGEGRIELYACNSSYTRLNSGNPIGTGKVFIISTEKDVWKRNVITIIDTLPTGTAYLEVFITADFTTYPSFKCLADGVQLVPMDGPMTYEPESNLWKMLRSFPGTKINNPTFIGDATFNNGMITLGKPDYFRAYQSVAQNLAATTFTKITFTNESYDIRSTYDATNSKFTASADGYFLLVANVRFTTVADETILILCVYKNGAILEKIDARTNGAAGKDEEINGSTILKLAKNDYIEIYAYPDAAVTTRTGTQETHWKMMRLG